MWRRKKQEAALSNITQIAFVPVILGLQQIKSTLGTEITASYAPV